MEELGLDSSLRFQIMNIVSESTSGYTRNLDHIVYVGPTEDIKKLSQKIIAEFDGSHLETYRKNVRQWLRNNK